MIFNKFSRNNIDFSNIKCLRTCLRHMRVENYVLFKAYLSTGRRVILDGDNSIYTKENLFEYN